MSPVSILIVVVLPGAVRPEEAEDLAARRPRSEMPRTASTFLPENGLRNVLARRCRPENDVGSTSLSRPPSSTLGRRGASGRVEYSWSLY